jgi:squalene synthase HpnC
MGVGHYENFPVASVLLPASLRPAVRAIYRFARTADDIADEGDATPAVRLKQLAVLGRQLDGIERGDAGDWPDLADAVARHSLPVGLLRDLLSAFAQDVSTTRYQTFDALRDYCRHSADPIGRLLLVLYRKSSAQTISWSDSICTGLQLANFWQDVAIDWGKGRVYLPQEDLRRFSIDEAQIATGGIDAQWSTLMAFQAERTRQMLLAGRPLTAALGGRAGLELRLVIQGGLRILERIDRVRGDVYRQRPTLASRDWLLMGWRALLTKAA